MNKVELVKVQQVNIILEGTQLEKVLKAVLEFGATGYTHWDCSGKGEHDLLANPYTGVTRTYVQVICNWDSACAIVNYCSGEQFRRHGMTVGTQDLWVSESESKKFVK